MGFRKIRRYSCEFSCGFSHSKQFPAIFAVLGNSAGIDKDLPANFDIPISCGFYCFRKFRR
jgi:hypothetical protein